MNQILKPILLRTCSAYNACPAEVGPVAKILCSGINPYHIPLIDRLIRWSRTDSLIISLSGYNDNKSRKFSTFFFHNRYKLLCYFLFCHSLFNLVKYSIKGSAGDVIYLSHTLYLKWQLYHSQLPYQTGGIHKFCFRQFVLDCHVIIECQIHSLLIAQLPAYLSMIHSQFFHDVDDTINRCSHDFMECPHVPNCRSRFSLRACKILYINNRILLHRYKHKYRSGKCCPVSQLSKACKIEVITCRCYNHTRHVFSF